MIIGVWQQLYSAVESLMHSEVSVFYRYMVLVSLQHIHPYIYIIIETISVC